jgi:hypothetical protein
MVFRSFGDDGAAAIDLRGAAKFSPALESPHQVKETPARWLALRVLDERRRISVGNDKGLKFPFKLQGEKSIPHLPL